jgi:hypothetical protein
MSGRMLLDALTEARIDETIAPTSPIAGTLSSPG